MTNEINIVAIIGSLRTASWNRVVFEAALSVTGPGVNLIEAPVAEVPLYNGDIEDAGDPPSVVSLKAAGAGADGVIFFTPEYNLSIPAVTKNAVDWLSRPYGGAAITDKPVGIVSATPGRGHGDRVREHLTATDSVLTPHVFDPSLGLSSLGRDIEEGRLIADDSLAELKSWLDAFASFVRVRQTSEQAQ